MTAELNEGAEAVGDEIATEMSKATCDRLAGRLEAAGYTYTVKVEWGKLPDEGWEVDARLIRMITVGHILADDANGRFGGQKPTNLQIDRIGELARVEDRRTRLSYGGVEIL